MVVAYQFCEESALCGVIFVMRNFKKSVYLICLSAIVLCAVFSGHGAPLDTEPLTAGVQVTLKGTNLSELMFLKGTPP